MEDFLKMTKSFAEEMSLSSEAKSRVETYDSFYNELDDKQQKP